MTDINKYNDDYKNKHKNKIIEKQENKIELKKELKQENNKVLQEENNKTLQEENNKVIKEEINQILQEENNNQNQETKIDNSIDYKLDNISYILDPLSVIIKLLILSKKPVGCKLSVYNNVLYIQSVGIFQSVVRYIYNNTKVDIQYLYNPIQIASLHFLNKNFVNEYPSIKKLFINAKKGLERLSETYNEYTFIIHTLYLYNNIITNHLGNNYNENLFIKDNYSSLYTDNIIEKLNSVWTPNRIKMLLNMIEFIEDTNSSDECIKCLEDFMITIDKEVESVFETKAIFNK
jgi:hypothetical protein